METLHGSGRSLLKVLTGYFPAEVEENHKKYSVRKADLWAEI
jgi:hypothetical protein